MVKVGHIPIDGRVVESLVYIDRLQRQVNIGIHQVTCVVCLVKFVEGIQLLKWSNFQCNLRVKLKLTMCSFWSRFLWYIEYRYGDRY